MRAIPLKKKMGKEKWFKHPTTRKRKERCAKWGEEKKKKGKQP